MQAKLPAGWFIAAWFWDIESGGLDLEQRGHGTAHDLFPEIGIPVMVAWRTCWPRRSRPTPGSPW